MNFRIKPVWWPILFIASPILIPVLLIKNKKYKKDKKYTEILNYERIEAAKEIFLPEIDNLELDVLVEWMNKEGYDRDPGVSYLFKTDMGSMLYDIGFGSETNTLIENAKRMNVDLRNISSLTISHLHMDHMGGLKAARSKQVAYPEKFLPKEKKVCYLPDFASAKGFESEIIKKPRLLGCGIATTGPLARSLFFLGHTEEQALVINLKGKGLVVFTGCGHPSIETIIKMVRKISDKPIYAIGGGLHFPVKSGRGKKKGIDFQTILGTGKPAWKKLSIKDINSTIEVINNVNPEKVFLSGHDTSDFALKYLKENLKSKTYVLEAGRSYNI